MASVQSTLPSTQGVATPVSSPAAASSSKNVASGCSRSTAGRHAIGQRAFDRLANDLRLVLAQRDEHDFAGVEDRRQAHRERLRGHVLFAEEIAGARLAASPGRA